jgi:ribosome recycling factor
MLDAVKVEYYGEPTPLAQVGSVSVPDARSIMIQPWDRTALQSIEKAILAANLGITPQNDGQVIRISVPPLTEERRKDIVKNCKKMAEDGKLAVRNIRRDANEELKKAEKTEHFPEDERKRGEDDVQKNTDKYVAEIDKILAAKEVEVMEE